MKLVHKISSWVILLLGLGHMAATPNFYPGFTAEALWFAGTGLGLFFLGLLNLVVIKTPDRTSLVVCIVADALASVYGVLIPFLVPEPQAYVAGVAFVAALAGSIWGRVVLQ
jgi:hypothetical protein